MKVEFKKSFKKSIDKLPKSIQDKFDLRFKIFLENKFHPLLNNHSIHPVYDMARSINITGDYRSIYVEREDAIVFVEIGTHSELYK